jgi:hypothetical protein
MNEKKWTRYSFSFLIFGCIQYIILIFIAMFFYSGGTSSNPSKMGYSFWENSLSDLGRTIAHSGEQNTLSMIFFTVALAIWGVSLIPFFIELRKLFRGGKIEKITSNFGTLFGIIAGICLIGISLTPDDILNAPHMYFVYIGYSSILLIGIFYTIALYLNKKFPKEYTYIFLLFTIIFLITTLIALFGLGESVELLAIGQKIGRFTTVASFAITAYGALKQE